MGKKRLLTIEDLINFCESQKMFAFNSKDSGKPIVVQADHMGYFEEEESEDDGFMHLKLRVAHINKNRNGSSISEENMKTHMGTLKYRPVLASIIPSPDDETVLDFNGHDMEFDKEGNVTYIESQVGCFTADEPYLEYNKEYDKTYVMAHALIPEEYTETANIIRRKGGTKVSCELLINELAYDSNQKCLDLIDFSFQGVCLLGEHVGEGMYGSRADVVSIEDFSKDNNSMFANRDMINENDLNLKLIETLEKLNNKLDDVTKLSNFNIEAEKSANENLEEGGNKSVTKFEELLEKYNKVQEDIIFEIENLTDEELEAKFEEIFGENSETEENENIEDENNLLENEVEEIEENNSEDESTDNLIDENNSEDIIIENEEKNNDEENNETEVSDNFSKVFSISHDDIKYALYNLLAPFEEIDNDWYWIVAVYNDHFVYQGCAGNYFGQKYAIENESVAFDGERYELFAEFLTKSEKAELETMRSNYSSIQTELNTYKTNEINAQKEEILADEAYIEFAETDVFKEIKEKIDTYSVDELRTACDLAFAKCVKAVKVFSLKDKENKPERKINKVGIDVNFEVNNDEPYGDYFKSLSR